MSTLIKIGKALEVLGIEEYIVRADALIDTEEKFNNAFRNFKYFHKIIYYRFVQWQLEKMMKLKY